MSDYPSRRASDVARGARIRIVCGCFELTLGSAPILTIKPVGAAALEIHLVSAPGDVVNYATQPGVQNSTAHPCARPVA
jgi:hypothetical protein